MAEAMDPEARATSLADVTLKDISTRYTLKNELGSGAQATVYLGQSKGSGSSKVAIKVLPLAELEDDEVYEALRMECTLAKQLRHPYIVQMVEVCRDKENVYVVMECLGGGELFEHLLAKGPFKEDYALTIFAQVALAVDYMHSVDIVHRDLKAENLVFAAKGSPVVKFIDFGGASTCGEGGLTGLVGTPQYVAPEVVKGFGDDSPTEIPYGKGCDLWSMGVLLYVMLSKTMPFRAKDIDKLLRQVVKGKFTFTPEDRWRPVSAEARDLITKLLCVDPAKRLTIADVKAHPWCAAAVAKCMATMPKVKAAPAPPKSAGGAGGLLKGLGLGRGTSGTSIVPKVSKGKGKKSPFGVGYVSKEAQYWYDIGDPTDVKQTAGAKLNADGTFNMDNVPEEMKAILADIEAKKAKAAGGGGRVSVQVPAGAPPAPPGAPPPPPGPPPDAGMDEAAAARRAQRTETNAMKHRDSAAMDTMLLINEKDEEISKLQQACAKADAEIEGLKVELDQAKAAAHAAAASTASGREEASKEELDAALAAAKAATARAEAAEAELASEKAEGARLQAQLGAVSTLYTEAMQREAAMRVMVEQLQGAQ